MSKRTSGSRKPQLVYGTDAFGALTTLAWRMAEEGRYRGTIRVALRNPRTVASLWLVVRLPRAEIRAPKQDLDDWRTGRYLPAFGTRYSGRRAQAVLTLPPVGADYLAGRHRQAARTNAAAASRSGVSAGVAGDYQAWRAAATSVLARRPGGVDTARDLGSDDPYGRLRLFIATDPHREPLAIAAVALIGDAALLLTLLSAPGHPDAAATRYLLHAAVVNDLVTRGQRHLLVGSALRQTPGIQYFQHLLGYRPTNLEVVAVGPPAAPDARSGKTRSRAGRVG